MTNTLTTPTQVDVEPFDDTCPTCGGLNPVPLGWLGPRMWFRCRDCGIDFNVLDDVIETALTEVAA